MQWPSARMTTSNPAPQFGWWRCPPPAPLGPDMIREIGEILRFGQHPHSRVEPLLIGGPDCRVWLWRTDARGLPVYRVKAGRQA